MKKSLPLIVFYCLLMLSCSVSNKNKISFNTDLFHLSINKSGLITEMKDVGSGKNYLSIDTIAPLLSIKHNGSMKFPREAQYDNKSNILNLIF